MVIPDGMKGFLIDVARASIIHGFHTRQAFPVDVADFAPELQVTGASFVTLNVDGALRGCIGTLDAWRPLVVDVAENAFAAAFQDPRFPPLTSQEYARIDIHISLLGAPEVLPFSDETDLLAKLRPGTDGLIIAAGARRATFLPSVWAELPDPRDFLLQLKRKAGLAGGAPVAGMKAWRYTAESIPQA